MKKIFTTCIGAATALLLFLAYPNISYETDSIQVPAKEAKIAKLGLDGYYIEREEYRHESINVKIVRYRSHQKLIDSWIKKFGAIDLPGDKTIRAFSEWRVTPIGVTCTIHIVEPKIDYQPQFMGHELMHCMSGSFHPTQPAKTKN